MIASPSLQRATHAGLRRGGALVEAAARLDIHRPVVGVRAGGSTLLVVAAVLSHVFTGAGIPCPLRTLTGVPCPLCGSTTSVRDALQLHLGAAFAASPLGLVTLVAAAVAVVRPAAIVRVATSRWVLALVPLLAVSWAFELHRFGFLHL